MLHDKDLEFLQHADNEDLRMLADYLTKDKDGETRFTEGLTYTQAYQDNYPDKLQNCWREIANELHEFGGNTLMNFLRGNGVPYAVILRDVAKKLKVWHLSTASVERIEELLLEDMFVRVVDRMNKEEIVEVIKMSGGSSLLDGKRSPDGSITRGVLIGVLKSIIRNSGFSQYKIAVTVANDIARAIRGKGLMLATNACGLIAPPQEDHILSLLGPAYRVTIPAVIHIAYMRTKSKTDLVAMELAEPIEPMQVADASSILKPRGWEIYRYGI